MTSVAQESLVSVSLVSGSVPTVLLVLGILGALWLLFARSHRYLRRAVPICLLVAAALTMLLYWVVEKLWRPFPDPIETQVYVYIGVGIAALLLMVPRVVVARRWYTRILSVLATLVVVACVAAQVNLVFDYYPTVGDGSASRRRTGSTSRPCPGPPRTPSADARWTALESAVGATGAGRTTGRRSRAGVRIRRPTRTVYLPPAYFTDPRPLLPVLVLLPGQPGEPSDWLKGGGLVATMDTFARGTGPRAGGGRRRRHRFGDGQPAVRRLAAGQRRHLPRHRRAELDQGEPAGEPRPECLGHRRAFLRRHLRAAVGDQPPRRLPDVPRPVRAAEPTLGDRQRTSTRPSVATRRIPAGEPDGPDEAQPVPGLGGSLRRRRDDDGFRDGQQKMYEAAKAAAWT